MKKYTLSLIVSAIALTTLNAASLDMPEGAEPGQCFKKVYKPAKYETTKEKVLVSEGSEKVVIVPAKYETTKERVLVKEGRTKLVPVPAKYKTTKERVLVKDEVTEWEKKQCHTNDNGQEDCGTVCLVKHPAIYKTITKRELVEPATTKTIEIPPVYKTITVRKLVKPEESKIVKTKPVYKTITKRELVEPSSYEWQRTVCKSTTPSVISEPVHNVTHNSTKNLDGDYYSKLSLIQIALKDRGYYTGPIDGIYGSLTKKAIENYQLDNGFKVTGKVDSSLDNLINE